MHIKEKRKVKSETQGQETTPGRHLVSVALADSTPGGVGGGSPAQPTALPFWYQSQEPEGQGQQQGDSSRIFTLLPAPQSPGRCPPLPAALVTAGGVCEGRGYVELRN